MPKIPLLFTNMSMKNISSSLVTIAILIPAWISNPMSSKAWDEITYPIINFNGCAVEVLEWISNFTPLFIMGVITYLGVLLQTYHRQPVDNHITWKNTYPFPNFNGCNVEDCEWISNFVPHVIMNVITYPVVLLQTYCGQPADMWLPSLLAGQVVTDAPYTGPVHQVCRPEPLQNRGDCWTPGVRLHLHR